MSVAVRRMVCDIPLWWLLFAALCAVLTPLADGLWLIHSDERMPLIVTIFLSPIAISLAAVKLPVWRLLPVSRRQIGRAQWWLTFGGPLILQLVSLALALVVVGLTGAMRASPAAVLALAGGGCAVGVAFPAMNLLAWALRKRVGATAAAIPLLLWLIFIVPLVFSPLSLTPALRFAFPLAGAIAIAVAIATYLISPVTFPDQSMVGRGSAHGPAGRLVRPGVKGWATLWRPFLGTTAFAAVVSTGLFIVMQLLTRQIDPIAAATGIAVLTMAPLIFGGMVRISARALRGVPVSAAVLTSGLLAAAAAAQLPAFAALYVACRLWRGPAAEVLALAPLVVGFGACCLALTLRGWWRVTPLVWLVVLPVSGFSIAHPTLAAAVVAAGVVSLAVGWLWIHFELSRGRSAYQPSAISASSWRGR